MSLTETVMESDVNPIRRTLQVLPRMLSITGLALAIGLVLVSGCSAPIETDTPTPKSTTSEYSDESQSVAPSSMPIATPPGDSSPLQGQAAEDEKARVYVELKEAQRPYSKRQNVLACSLIITDPIEAREMFEETETRLTWDQFVEPVAASCMEWVGDLSEEQMLAELLYQREVAQDRRKTCDVLRKIGKDAMRDAFLEYLELNGEPAALAKPLVAILARECERR
jgi:hypothetical protein